MAPPLPDALDALRAEIDALDDQLHDLLMRRADVVDRLARSRAKAPGTTLRPGREAAILRRLLARHRGAMPARAVVRLWRELFASSIQQQAGFAVAVAPGAEDAARLHFGPGTPLRLRDEDAALNAVRGGSMAVAVLPWPSPKARWWQGLDATRLHIIARLPFLDDGSPAAAVVGPAPADPSGADRTVLRRGDALSEAEGFLTEAPAGATILGHYAIPHDAASPRPA
ncbi:MAG: chorismate mutase [Acetobacteraceae bacterium]|nr:chorismate mutase [Acetobacteraceae bacterium]